MKEWTIELDFDRYATVYAKTLDEAEDLAEEEYGVDFIRVINENEEDE